MKALTNEINPAFNLHAELFTDTFSRAREPERQSQQLATLIRRLAPSAISVLELGCGAGDICIGLSALGFRLTGVDRSARMIDIAKRRHGNNQEITWIVADFMQESYLPNADVVLLLYSVVHTFLSRNAQILCIKKSAQRLKEDGLLIIEGKNDAVYSRSYVAGRRYHVRVVGKRIVTWMLPFNSEVNEVHFLFRDIREPDGKFIEFVHRLRTMDYTEWTRLMYSAGLQIVEMLQAPRFDSTFNPKKSNGVLLFAKPLLTKLCKK